MKINRIVCDKCGKEIEKGNEIRAELKKKCLTDNGFSKGFVKFKEYDLCEECFKEFTTHIK